MKNCSLIRHTHEITSPVLLVCTVADYSLLHLAQVMCFNKRIKRSNPEITERNECFTAIDQGQQPTSFRCVTGATSFGILICFEYQQILFLLITYLRQAVCTKCRYKRTIFHNKCELLKYCSYRKHFDQIHHCDNKR